MSTSHQTPLQILAHKNIFYIGFFCELLIFDFITKFFAELYLRNGKSVEIIKGFFSLHVSHNTNIAFSLPVPGQLVALVTPLLLVAIFLIVKNSCDISKIPTKIALALMSAGTIGNFIDRVWHGYVVDFLAPSFFPTFNLADAYLTIGVLILIGGYRWIAKTSEFSG